MVDFLVLAIILVAASWVFINLTGWLSARIFLGAQCAFNWRIFVGAQRYIDWLYAHAEPNKDSQ